MQEQKTNFYKYYTLLAITAITIQLVCNIVVKKIVIVPFSFVPISALIFTLYFSIGDLIAEVYGYKAARQVIWLNIYSQFIFGSIIQFSLLFDSPEFWRLESAFNELHGNILYLQFSGTLAILTSSFFNAYIISKFKIKMRGKRFWVRSFIASLLSQGILVMVAYTMTFFFDYNFKKIFTLIITAWAYKIPFIIFLLFPTTYLTKLIKNSEKLEHFDYGISYNPFGFAITERYEYKNATK